VRSVYSSISSDEEGRRFAPGGLTTLLNRDFVVDPGEVDPLPAPDDPGDDT
jgi:hypothetical protein